MSLNKFRLLDEDQLLQSLEETGYHEIKRMLDGRSLNGRKLLELSEFQTRPWKLSSSQKTTLFDFIKEVTENPSLIIKPEPVNTVYHRNKVILPPALVKCTPKPQSKISSNLSKQNDFQQLREIKINANPHFKKAFSPPPVPVKPPTPENNRTIDITKYGPDPTEPLTEYDKITQEYGYNHPKRLVPKPEIFKHDQIPIFADKAASSHNKPSQKYGIKRYPLPAPTRSSDATRLMHPKSKPDIKPLREYNDTRSQNVSIRPKFLAIPPALPPENIDLKQSILTNRSKKSSLMQMGTGNLNRNKLKTNLTSEPVITPSKYPTNRLGGCHFEYLNDRIANTHSQNKGIRSSLDNLLKIQFYDKANNSMVNLKTASKPNKGMIDEEEKIEKTRSAERPQLPLPRNNRPKSLGVGGQKDPEIRHRSNSYEVEQNKKMNSSKSDIRNIELNTTNLQQITNKTISNTSPTSKHKWKSNESILGNTADDHSKRNWLGNLNKLFAKNKATKDASRPQEVEKVNFRDRPLPPIPTFHKKEWNSCGDLLAGNIYFAPKEEWNNADLATSNTDSVSYYYPKIEWNSTDQEPEKDDDDDDDDEVAYEKVICGKMSPDEETNLLFDWINWDDTFFRDTDLAGAKKRLRNLPDGAFLFRPAGQFLVLTLKYKGQCYNLGIERSPNNKMRIRGDTTSDSPEFWTLRGFVDYFTRKPVTFRDNDDCLVEICLNPMFTKNLT